MSIAITRRLALIILTVFVLSAGCRNQSGTSRIGDPIYTSDSNDAAAMMAYLQNQDLPALQSVRLWKSDYGPALKLITKHYEIYTTLLDPLMLSRLPAFMECAYREYNRQLPYPIESTTRFTIYLFARRSQWEVFTGEFAGSWAAMYRKMKAGAYYLNGACVAYNIGRERTFSVLGHEGWHQFNHRYFKFRLPSWLDEGVAMLFESYSHNDGLFDFTPGANLYRLGELKRTLLKDKMIPLRELITMNPGQVLLSDTQDSVSAFYSQSYALVRFLREDGFGRRLHNYQQLLLDGLNGNWPLSEQAKRIAADRNIPLTVRFNRIVSPVLFSHYIGDDFDQLEKQYLAFCRKIVYHVHFGSGGGPSN